MTATFKRACEIYVRVALALPVKEDSLESVVCPGSCPHRRWFWIWNHRTQIDNQGIATKQLSFSVSKRSALLVDAIVVVKTRS